MSTPAEFLGQVALITGAARGIGLGIARHLAKAGAHVLIADINVAAGEQACALLREDGMRADFIPSDLSMSGGPATMVAQAVQIAGRLDILVNNARAGRRHSFLDETEANWDMALNVDLKAAFFAAQSAASAMAPKGGSIVNISSVAAIQTTNESPSYHAAKAGLLQLTRYLAVAAAPHGVRVNCVLPGLIVQDEHRSRFDAADNSDYRALALGYQPGGNVGSERDVAGAVHYFCSAGARYVSGACLTLDGAATAQEPFGLLLRQRTTGAV